jgi:uncharacterized protein (TIGR02611 family)
MVMWNRTLWKPTLRHARRVVVAVVGFTLVLAGIAMIVTPGPGWLTILLGLSVLAVEFVWARRLLKRLKQHGTDLSNKVFGKSASQQEHSADKRTSKQL